MFKKKKQLYKDKKYFLLFLSILSDISLTTVFTFFIFMLLWCTIDPDISQGIGFYWVISVSISIFIGIPSKLIDVTNIKYIDDEKGLKEHKMLGLHLFYQGGVIPHPQPKVGWGCKPNIGLIQI